MPACRKKQNIHDGGPQQTSARGCPLSNGGTYPDSEEAAPQGKEVEGKEGWDKEGQKPQVQDPSEAAGKEENGALQAQCPT